MLPYNTLVVSTPGLITVIPSYPSSGQFVTWEGSTTHLAHPTDSHIALRQKMLDTGKAHTTGDQTTPIASIRRYRRYHHPIVPLSPLCCDAHVMLFDGFTMK